MITVDNHELLSLLGLDEWNVPIIPNVLPEVLKNNDHRHQDNQGGDDHQHEDDHHHQDNQGDGNDHIISWNQAGTNRMRLVPSENVYIQREELKDIRERIKNPKKMVKQLFKEIVGVDALKGMTVRVRKPGTVAVPLDVSRAVNSRFYVLYYLYLSCC